MTFMPHALVDGYKLDHRRQYPDKTTSVYSNWTPRGSRNKGRTHVVFLGLQAALKKYLMVEMQQRFFCEDKDTALLKFQRRIDYMIPGNTIGTEHLADLHDLGYLPLEFKALPEGTLVPLRVPMFTVENTVPEFFWLTNYYETLLSSLLWLPCTSATTAYEFRKLLEKYANLTGGPKDFVKWQGHDFSFRGMQGPEAAALSGLGHLLSFLGTDNLPALDFIDEYYRGRETYYRSDSPILAGTVPATEHAVMCAGGKVSEIETFRRLMALYPEGILSVVSDTWDYWRVLTAILPELKPEIMARNGKLVIRPDSGDPVKIICGDPESPINAAMWGTVEILYNLFGGTINDQGYKELDPHIGVIYGDSITMDRCKAICAGLEDKGFASTNVVYGMGSYLYGYVTRDTNGFAMKATHANVDGQSHDLWKDPITDSGEKKSAKGRLSVMSDMGGLFLVEQANKDHESKSLLKTVFKDGHLKVNYTFEEIRNNLWPAS